MAATTTTQANIRSLAEELIAHESGLSNERDPENFALARDYALKKFKTHKFGRTNQFDVISRLDGLEEKFRIKNAEDLADALEDRIKQLPSLTAGVTPEILQLLLELSDEPLLNTKLEDLEKLKRPEGPKPLTWEDILAEEPFEGELWEDVDFGAESSDAWSDDDDDGVGARTRLWEDAGDALSSTKRQKRKAKEDDDPEEGYRVAGVEGFVINADKEGLERMKAAQYWKRSPVEEMEKTNVDVSLSSGGLDGVRLLSELEALRETLFMLLGYPCVLYEFGKDNDASLVSVNSEDVAKRWALRHISRQAFTNLIEWFADRGTSLRRLRAFTSIIEELPERQSFIFAIDRKLAELDKELITIEERYVGTGSSETVSLLNLQCNLEPLLRPFGTLSKVTDILSKSPSTHSSHIEHLYRSACDLQSVGDLDSYRFIASVFFLCLHTYLRPIRIWMESGLLPPTTDFLVAQTKADDEVELDSLWHLQFHLRRSPTGSLDAPSFVRPVADRILTTGKSVVFLKRLLPSLAAEFDDMGITTAQDASIDFEDVCIPGTELAPFSSLLSASFNRWISARHHSVSSRLREQLFTSCGLWKSLDALELIYFGRNGYLFESLAQGIFDKLDRKTTTWSDRFLLTELIQEVFTGVSGVESHRLRMGVRKESNFNSARSLRDSKRSVKLFEGIVIDYRLSWPVMNIIQRSSFNTYQAIFTFLLQLRRCRGLLERLKLLRDLDSTSKNTQMAYYALKQRLLWFVNILFAYITDLVLRPQTEFLREEMQKAVDVDAMCQVHSSFIERIRDMCLLGKNLAPFYTSVVSILNLVVRFADAQQKQYASEGGGAVLPFLPTPRHMKKRRGSDTSDSSGDEDLPTPSAPSETAMGDSMIDEEDEELDGEERYCREMKKMQDEFQNSVGFVKDGLRGVARAGVMPHLEMLADSLEGYGTVSGWLGR